MEEKHEKNNTVLLTVIGAATLLVAVVGATFAYFSAQITGNVSETNVHVSTGKIGTTVFQFPKGTELKLENTDLPYSSRGTDDITNTDSLEMYTITDNALDMGLNLNVTEITNTFCQYYDEATQLCLPNSTITGVCMVAGVYNSEITAEYTCNATEDGQWRTVTLIDKRSEVEYTLYECPTANIKTVPDTDPERLGQDLIICEDDAWAVVTDQSLKTLNGDTSNAVPSGPFPAGVSEFKLLDMQKIGTDGTQVEYFYKLTAVVHNSVGNQNYNQGKSIHAKISAEIQTSPYPANPGE